MFCMNCGKERIDNAKFCHACGKDFPCSSTTTMESSKEKEQLKEKPLTFLDFSKAKSKSWFKKVKGDTSKKSDEVMINIGILAWNEKSNSLKPIRGKRVCLRTPSQASYETIRPNAVKRMTNFYNDLINESEHYYLAFENGEIAYFIPGTTEDFHLSKYKNELGKDYKAITLYLLAENDKSRRDPLNDDIDRTEDDFENPCKKFRSGFDQEVDDKFFAESLQALFDDEFPIQVPDEHDPPNVQMPLMKEVLHTESENLPKSVAEILVDISMNIKNNGHFFLNIRRNCDIQRVLNIWSRQKKQSPEHRLMVKFIGESGIDSGALSKEFFTDVIPKLRESMFPNGAPKESMSDVENGNFFYCGQIMAASLVQGGPPPSFLHKSVFNLLCNDSFDMKNLKTEDFVPSDNAMFDQIRNNPEENASFIIDNGYTGHISKENVDPILRTVMIGMISRRRTYLEEVVKGLQLYGLYPKIVQNRSTMESLFVNTSPQIVDSTYLISKLNPVFSLDGTNKKRLEETFVDYLQDLINNLEDSNITGITEEAVANIEPPEILEDTIPYGKEAIADLSVAGLRGWLTGQKHCALFGEDLIITVLFDHECHITYGPDHKVCFPIVSACSKELTLPTQHCHSYLEFQENFILAFSKGQAFGRS